MKPLLLAAALVLAACGPPDHVPSPDAARVSVLEARVAQLEADVQSLARVSRNNSAAIISNSNSIGQLADIWTTKTARERKP